MRSLILVATLMVVEGSCHHDGLAKRRVPDGAVGDALAAQLFGPGGCRSLDVIDTVTSKFFPAVTLMRGICESEHGDTTTGLAAVDDSGMLYVLGSPSSFNFLLRRHRPSGLDSANAIEFARQALGMMGELVDDPRTVFRPEDVPRRILDSLGPEADLQLPTQLVAVQHRRFTVSLVVLSGLRLSRYSGTVNTLGQVFMTRSDLWTSARVH